MRVYKVFRSSEWAAFEGAGETQGSPDDAADGFVHLSTADQLGGTLARHFKGETDLVLVAVETDELGDDLKWESARSGQDFPHLYRPLRMEDVVWHRPIPRDGVGGLTLGA